VARLVSIDNVLMSGSGDTLVLFPRASIMARGVVYLKLDFDSAGNLRVADQNKTEPSFIAAPFMRDDLVKAGYNAYYLPFIDFKEKIQ
jgi:hypothetical protein